MRSALLKNLSKIEPIFSVFFPLSLNMSCKIRKDSKYWKREFPQKYLFDWLDCPKAINSFKKSTLIGFRNNTKNGSSQNVHKCTSLISNNYSTIVWTSVIESQLDIESKPRKKIGSIGPFSINCLGFSMSMKLKKFLALFTSVTKEFSSLPSSMMNSTSSDQ